MRPGASAKFWVCTMDEHIKLFWALLGMAIQLPKRGREPLNPVHLAPIHSEP